MHHNMMPVQWLAEIQKKLQVKFATAVEAYMRISLYPCIQWLVDALALKCMSRALYLSMLGHSYTYRLQFKRVPSPAQSLDSNAQMWLSQPTVDFQNFWSKTV